MPSELLWIVKDLTSDSLSQSTRSDESKIRRHVQLQRRNDALSPESTGTMSREVSEQHDVSIRRITSGLPMPRITLPFKSSNVRLTDTEARGLEFYIYSTARECCGWQDEPFWNTLVIQTCFTNPAIAHALISIGSWHKSLNALPRSNEAGQMCALTSSQWLKALAYGRTLESTAYSMNLIHCVILACLQAHQSDYQDFRLLRSAAGILQELDVPGQTVSEVECDLINKQVRPLVERLQARICTICDLPAALLRSAELRRELGLPVRELPAIPVHFSTLRQARDCLESIFSWGHDQILHDDAPIFACETRELLSTYVNHWYTALPAPSPAVPANAISLLHLSSLHGLILLQTCTAPTEMAFDAHIPTFATMMHLVASLSPSYPSRSTISFGIDSGLLDIVAFVATRCREPRIRRAAITWLQTASRTEGDRPSLSSAQIAHAWLQLEEGSLALPAVCAADVTAEHRWKLMRGSRYHSRNLVKLEFVSRTSQSNDGAAQRRVEVCIEEKTDTLQHSAMDTSNLPLDWELPDVVIEKCGAAFLEDRDKAVYHRVQLEQFYFPIPRI